MLYLWTRKVWGFSLNHEIIYLWPYYFCQKMAENNSTPPPIIGDEIVIPAGILITLENVISFSILYRCTRVNYQIRILSINLCLSDLITGISLCFPIEAYTFGHKCGLKKYFNTTFVTISLLTVTMMDIDRCLVIHYGIQYYNYISRRLLTIVCICFWFVSLLIGYMMYFDYDGKFGIHCEPMYHAPKNAITIFASTFLLVSILSNIVMFIFLVLKIRRGYHKRKDVNFPAQMNMRFTEQAMVIKKLMVITGCFIFCASPYIITTFPVLDYKSPVGKRIHMITAVTLLANSAINPILYVWRFREARYHMKRLLCFWNEKYIEQLQSKHNEENATYIISGASPSRISPIQ